MGAALFECLRMQGFGSRAGLNSEPVLKSFAVIVTGLRKRPDGSAAAQVLGLSVHGAGMHAPCGCTCPSSLKTCLYQAIDAQLNSAAIVVLGLEVH